MSDNNIPHAARMVNQFRVEEGAEGTRKHFVGTGKVMCWCNCGAVTGWLDRFDGAPYAGEGPVQKFFQEHEAAEEIGIRMYYSLGEITGYVIETEDSVNGAVAHLVHKCGWSENISDIERPLTDIVMMAQNNKHICGKTE